MWRLVVMPDDDRFIHDAYVSGACVGAASTGVWSCKGRPWAGASLNLLLGLLTPERVTVGYLL